MRMHARLWLLALLAVVAAACSAPGSDREAETPAPAAAEPSVEAAPAEPDEPVEPTESTEPAEPSEPVEPSESTETAESSEPAEPSEAAAPGVPTELTTDPVSLEFYIEPSFPVIEALGAEFMRQYPNVSIEYRKDAFANLLANLPRVLAGDDPPDLARVTNVGEYVPNGLLLDLDPYSEAYGWDEWPQSILSQARLDEDGYRGSGSLYGLGLGYEITGVFYNKALAQRAGMTEPPNTLGELDELMAAAKAAGIQPIIGQNAPIAGTLLPYQMVMNQYVGREDMNAWIFLQPGAVLNSPEALAATEHFNRWIEAGYFQPDVNAIEYATHLDQFIDGEGLFLFIGNWEAARLGEHMGDNVGFFLFPPLESGGPHVAMSVPTLFAASAASENADEVAFFLNWVHTDPEARRIVVEVAGTVPGGPADLPIPVEEGTLAAETMAAATVLGTDDGAVDFIANAVLAVFLETASPELQNMFAGRQTPQGLIDEIQAAYEDQLDG